ncbi:peptidase S8/S53 domain-containing protein, partial [Mycena pura]
PSAMRSLAFAVLFTLVSASARHNYETHNYYVVEHDTRQASLTEIANALGVEVVHPVGELRDHWLVRAPKISADIASREEPTDRVLDTYARLRARSRDPALAARDVEVRAGTAIKYLSRQTLRQRVKRAPLPSPQSEEAEASENVRAVALRLGIIDPLFPKQWHLINDEAAEHSMNVIPVWEMGFTGKGIISSFVDDGLDYTSEDLKDNFDEADSYDFNDHEPLPTPKLSDDTHGTRCAGQVGAIKNTACGIGIAYNSKVAGVRILSGAISDADEAAALNYGFQNVSIYSCSWGPPDTGTVMEGPDYLINKAVLHGINAGRGGKGSIFVFASGNGAGSGDQCNFDGYTNSIYSVTVSAVDHKGLRPYYSEACTANMIAAYSSGSGKSITTTDKGKNKCASTHGGTSAAAPNAVGVFALALEARPDLTWRDIQHLCVENARMINADDHGWELTAAGRNYSSKFGYGVLDGAQYVRAAQTWENVKPQTRLRTRTVQLAGGKMDPVGNFSGGAPIDAGGVSSVQTVKRGMLQSANFEKLEHITVRVWIEHTRRGDVHVELRSPNGVKSVLAEPRRSDSASTGYPGWTFMTIKHWGEDIIGDWTLTVSDQETQDHNGKLLGWDMVFWGSVIDSAKAVLYELADEDPVLPPHDETPPRPPTAASAANTKSHPKPTNYLTAEESGASSALPQASTTAVVDAAAAQSSSATTESLPTPSHESSLFAGVVAALRRKLVIGILLVAALSFTGGILVWRYTNRRRGAAPYISLPPDAVQMADRRGGDDSDEEPNERTGLTSESPHHLGIHSGFLDDDEDDAEYPPSAGRGSPAPAYRDEPSGTEA